MTKPIKTLTSKIAFSCPWYNVRQDGILLPDGTHGTYNVVDAPPCVFIVPLTPDGQIVLIRQYRYTVQQWVWEIPAGGLQQGQTPLDAARQELREEIGGVSNEILSLGTFHTANGRTSELGNYFVAKNVQLGESEHESSEVITIHPTPVADVLGMLQRNEIKDAPSALALHLARPHFE